MTHLKLAGLIALAGLVFTSRPWLQFLNKMSPEAGLLLKNIIVFGIIYLLHFTDGAVALPHRSALGIFLIYVAFMMIFNYQSDWIAESGSDDVGDQTVDGAVYHRAREVARLSPDVSRLVTFVLVPFVLAFAGSRLMKRGQKMNLD